MIIYVAFMTFNIFNNENIFFQIQDGIDDIQFVWPPVWQETNANSYG
mgnify:CR=1 FL=1